MQNKTHQGNIGEVFSHMVCIRHLRHLVLRSVSGELITTVQLRQITIFTWQEHESQMHLLWHLWTFRVEYSLLFYLSSCFKGVIHRWQ